MNRTKDTETTIKFNPSDKVCNAFILVTGLIVAFTLGLPNPLLISLVTIFLKNLI